MSRSICKATLSASALVAILAQPALSQETEPTDGSGIPTVVIIGVTALPGAEINADEVAAPVQRATAEDIARAHAVDLTEFMRREIGSVFVNDIQNNALQPDVSYRGYTASPLLGTPQGMSVYMDGVRLNQPFGDVVSWDLIPRDALATMTLVPGSNPLFGLNTLGGALDLRTKDGFSAPGYSVGVNYGSSSRREYELEAGGHAKNGVHWYGIANKLKDNGWREDSPTDAWQVFAKGGWRSEVTDVALSGAFTRSDLTGNGLQDLQFLERDFDSVYTKPDNTQNRAYLFNFTGTHEITDTITLGGNGYFRHIRTGTFNGDINDESLGENLYQPDDEEIEALTEAGFTGFPLSGETQANTPFPMWRCIANILLNTEPNEKCNGLENQSLTEQREGGFGLQATFTTPIRNKANQFTVGVGWLKNHAKFRQSSRFAFLTPDRGVASVDGPGAFADGTQDSEDTFDARVDLRGDSETRSIFLTDTFHFTPQIALTLSGRFDRTTISSVDGITPEGEPGSLTADHHFARFNPAAGLTVAFLPSLTAYFGYNEGSRAPSAIELGCADPENPCRLPNALAGDPPLDQVVTRTFETGVRGTVEQWLAWNVGFFHADNHDDIMFVTNDVSGFGFFENFGKTRRLGVEAGLSGRLGPVGFGAHYTFLDATFRSAEEVSGSGNSTNEEGPGFEGTIEVEPGDRIPLIPRHLFKAFADWQIIPQFSLNLDLITVDGSFARGNENNRHEPDGVFYLGPGRSGGYTVVNLGGEYRPIEGLSLFAQGFNIFDRRYYSAAQLGATGFDAAGNFVARPFDGPVIDGERPLRNSTFFAPGAPRAYWLGVRYTFTVQ